MAEKPPDLDILLKEICKSGCQVSRIENEKALEFIEKVVAAKKAGAKPIIERTAELLEKYWGVEISRRALSEHVRGKCGCWKKKEKTL